MHGVILQTPLPPGAKLEELAAGIDPAKDVDGANPVSLGRLASGLSAYAPATAEAVIALLDHHEIALEGRHVAVVGRSNVVGKPVAHLLLNRHATVTTLPLTHPWPHGHHQPGRCASRRRRQAEDDHERARAAWRDRDRRRH